MSDRNKDELARLLRQMAAGQHPQADDPQEHDEAAQPASYIEAAHESAPAPAAMRRPPTPLAGSSPSPSHPKVAPARRQHLVQTLAFKRTIIPVLLTLGVLCPVLGVLGFVVSPLSPYAKLAEWWFSIPFMLIGLVMLGLGILTMLQVRNELAKRRS